MFMKERESNDLIQIEEIKRLISPLESEVVGRRQSGEEEQDAKQFSKTDLVFPSGESLPRCWIDQDYRLEN